MKTIKISCDQAGGVKIDADGFVGTSCEEATQVFEQAYSGKRTDNPKPEYYMSEGAGTKVDQRF